MTAQKRTSASKRTKRIRDCKQTKNFINDWERLEHSGRQDMNILKEAMLMLIANDAPLPPEWNDHNLKGEFKSYRECHIKGDLLLVYEISEIYKGEFVAFIRAGTHSEIFK